MVYSTKRHCVGVLFASVLSGCISREPTDLAFVSVEAVDQHEQMEMSLPLQAPLIGMISPERAIDHSNVDLDEKPPHRLLLKVRFSSKTDLSDYSRNGFNLGAWPVFCDRFGETDSFSVSRVYSQGALVGPWVDNLSPRGQFYSYYIYVIVSNAVTVIERGAPVLKAYNIQAKPESVCFYLAGGNGISGYKSNLARAPKEAIIEALKDAPKID